MPWLFPVTVQPLYRIKKPPVCAEGFSILLFISFLTDLLLYVISC